MIFSQSTAGFTSTLEALRLVAQGSVGVALIVVFYMFLRDRAHRDKIIHDRDSQYLDSIDKITRELSLNQQRSDERFERLMDRVIINGHEMASAVSEIKDAVNNQGRALASLEAVVRDIRQSRSNP